MEQDPSLLQDQAEVMDVAAADKVEALKGRKDGPSRAMLKSIWLSVLHVLDLWASRHDLLVIPKSGDNKHLGQNGRLVLHLCHCCGVVL